MAGKSLVLITYMKRPRECCVKRKDAKKGQAEAGTGDTRILKFPVPLLGGGVCLVSIQIRKRIKTLEGGGQGRRKYEGKSQKRRREVKGARIGVFGHIST